MPISCPAGSTLPSFCIGGQLEPTCRDDVGEWPTITVRTQLLGAGRDPVIDPTNCAIIVDTVDETILTGTAGCWCTCNLPANFNADDPDLALQPSGLVWDIRVFAELPTGVTELVAGPFEVAIDGARDYADIDECCIIQGPCGDCINITCLLDAPPTVTPTNRFCTAVEACLSPIQGAGILAGNVTGSYQDGWEISLTCEDIEDCIPAETPLVITTDGNSTGVNQTGTVNHTANIVVTSTDDDNLVSIGDDGGSYMDCAAIWGCLGDITGTGLLEGKVTGNYEDGWEISLTCEDIEDCLPDAAEIPDLVITTDGDSTGVTPDPSDDHTVNIVVTDSAASNIAEIGPNGGTLVTCESVKGCMFIEYVQFNPVTHDAGTIEGAGTAADPWQIPLPTVDVEIENIVATGTVTNPDGSTTITYTVTETDDNDANPATHTFDVSIPAAADLNFTYVTYDAATHANGEIEGSGTTADPWQIPVCCDVWEYAAFDPARHTAGNVAGAGTTADPFEIPLTPDVCAQLVAMATATGPALATDQILVLNPVDDTCRLATIPSGTTDTNTTYTLVDQGNGTFRLIDNSGGVISTINLCNLIDDITVAASMPTGGLVLSYDPVAETCQLAPAPSGGTIDLCDELENVTDAADCTDGSIALITNDCEVVTLDQIRPSHIFGTATTVAETCTGMGSGVATSGPNITSMAEQSRGQLGELVVGGNQNLIPFIDIAPLVIPLPAATNGCVQVVQVSWGGSEASANFGPELGSIAGNASSTGDTANLSAIGNAQGWGGLQSSVFTQMFAVDVTGTGGGTMRVNFPGKIPNPPDGLLDGVVSWFVYEVCGISVSDINNAGIQKATSAGPPSGSGPQAVPSTWNAPAINMGTCDALYFGVGRHVGPENGTTGTNVDMDWTSNAPAVNEVLNAVSFNQAGSGACQMGSVGGWIPANSGGITFSSTHNSPGVASNPAQFVSVPLACSTGGAGDPVCETATATLNASNPTCNPQARQKVDITGNICVSVCPDSRIQITPYVGGTALDPIVFDNVGNADGIEQCIPYQYTETLAAVIPPGGSAAALNVYFEVAETEDNGCSGDAVLFNEWTLESELVHV